MHEAEVSDQLPIRIYDNKAIATVFYETADLMEINGDDGFRVRSYRRAAEAIESFPQQISSIADDEKKLLEIPGIGKGMAANIRELLQEGRLRLHTELLKKYRPSMLDLLNIQGLGPKTIALIWSAYQVCDIDGVEKLARERKLRILPRLSEKSEQKILKSIETYRSITGRYYLDFADRQAAKIVEHMLGFRGVEAVTPAGSLRRGRETVGDLDILITGPACVDADRRPALVEHVLRLPGILDVLARGDNKVSFKMRSGMQVDVRLLAPDSFGAALQYFTGSKSHNVEVRQRALKLGYTLNEYELKRLDTGERIAARTESDVYSALGMEWIPPELRENCGEIDAALTGKLPRLITVEDLQGEVHMHTVETDGKCTIAEMAEAARARGYKYIAITEHSKNLAFANGLDDTRTIEHMKKIRAAASEIDGIRIFAGIEVDILADGSLDLSDSVLEQLDVVVASVHSHFNQEPQQMTDRLLRAIGNRNVDLIGHPTGRILLRRNGYQFDFDQVFRAAAERRVALELNAYPDRLDLCDQHLRMAKAHGARFMINTDAHHVTHFEKVRYGVLQARRAWLTPDDVLNCLPADAFARELELA